MKASKKTRTRKKTTRKRARGKRTRSPRSFDRSVKRKAIFRKRQKVRLKLAKDLRIIEVEIGSI